LNFERHNYEAKSAVLNSMTLVFP